MNISAKFAFFILFVVVFLGEMSKDPEQQPPVRAAPPPLKKILPPLPEILAEGVGDLGPQSLNDEIIEIIDEEKAEKSQYIGTAFSIDGRGLWVTARHVTYGCDQLVLLRPRRSPLRVKNLGEHERADVSILQTDGGAAALPIEYSAQEYDQPGFHFGFPRGEPGSVYSKLIGRRTINSKGTRYTREPVLVWAEKIRIPDSNASLGGISGGPILNSDGSVVGIHVAGSVRRGRSYSSLPSKIDELLNQNDVKITNTQSPVDLTSLTPTDFSYVGEDLRGDYTVAQVVCKTD
jgi:serine protease Do